MRRSQRSPDLREDNSVRAPGREGKAYDLGLSLSVYRRHEDGSLLELGNAQSPLTRQSAAGTWPTEQ